MIQGGLIAAFVWVLVQGLDRLLSWQALQRPLITATVTGLLLGDLQTGILMGASLEAIFMGISAIGGAIPSDACAGSILAVAMTVLTGCDVETGLALAMPIGTVLATVNELWKTVLASFSPFWEKLAESGKDGKFLRTMVLFGVIVDRLPQTVILFVSVAFGVEGLAGVIDLLPAWIMNGFGAASGMMTAVGFAILTSMIWSKEIGGYFFVGYVLAKYLSLDMLPIAIVMAAVAVAYFFYDKKLLDMQKAQAVSGGAEAAGEEDFF